jgi:hypothetical protein
VIDPDVGKGDIPSLVDALKNLSYYTKQCERFSLQVWQELLSKACTPHYTVKITLPNLNKSSKKPMLVAHSDIPVRDTDPESPFDGISPPSLAKFGSPSTVLVHVKKLELPITEINIVFKNILRLLAQLDAVFTDKVIFYYKNFDFKKLL